MHIEYISIKGYRSFNDKDGIELKDLKRFNLFIGPNNAGKSNLMRFFSMVKGMTLFFNNNSTVDIASLSRFNGHHRGEQDSRFRLTVDHFWDPDVQNIIAEVLIKMDRPSKYRLEPIDTLFANLGNQIVFRIESALDFWNSTDGKKLFLSVIPHIGVRMEESQSPIPIPSADDKSFADLIQNFFRNYSERSKTTLFQTWSDIKILGNYYFPLVKYSQGRAISIFEEPVQHLKQERTSNAGRTFEEVGNKAIYRIAQIVTDMVYAIGPIRAEGHISDVMVADHGDINPINKMFIDYNDGSKRTESSRFRDKIKTWLRQVLQTEGKIEISFNKEGKMQVELETGKASRPQFLEELGSGISQIVILISTLLFERENPRFVFIDEPENCLHPGAVLELIRILKDPVFAKHQFFISTHSNALLDAVDDDFTVHRVTMDRDRGTQMVPCKSLVQHHQLLNDLGCRASQIMQTNFVFWVEGPSDRIYIKSWIEALAKDKFLEDKHYAFIYYGGSVLAHLVDGSNSGKDPINIFATGRNGIIVMDSDMDQDDDSEKSVVTRIREQFPIEATQLGVGHWITKGREIENYIPKELWVVAKEMDGFVQRYAGKGSERIRLGFQMPEGFELAQGDDFALKLAECYTDSEGKPLESKVLARVKKHHDNLKVRMASALSGKWSEANMQLLGLKDQVQDLVERIKKANGIVG